MSKNRRDEPRPPNATAENLRDLDTALKEHAQASPFLGPFRCVGMARTADGFVTVTVDFGADGFMTGLVLGRPQSAPHGQPYVAGEAKHILLMSCLAS